MTKSSSRLAFRLRTRVSAASILILSGGLLAACGAREEKAEQQKGPAPLVVIGIDAATWDVMDPMIERGELPNIAKLRREGAHGDLLVLPPLSSPVVWTTYLTGHVGRRHGVLDHTFPYQAGAKRRVTSELRREPALWNLATHFGRRSAIIGYYASHPAEEINGVMVSDRADQVEGGGFSPAEIEAPLKALQAELESPERLEALRAAYFPIPYDPKDANQPGSPFADVLRSTRRVDRGLRHEAFVAESALEILESSFEPGQEPFDLFVAYLRMPDITCHTTWRYFDDSTFEEKSPQQAKELLGACIPEAYRQADAFLGRLVAALDTGFGANAYNLVALSDHGCGPATGRHAIGRESLQHMSGNHFPNGMVLARGPDIRPGKLPMMPHLDVMPTLLALSDLPISRQLPGAIHEPLLRPGLLGQNPPRYADAYRLSWRTVDSPTLTSSEAETEELAALAALGYVESDTAVAQAPQGESHDFDFWQIEDRLMNSALLGEAMSHLIREDPEALRRLIAEVQENRPDFAMHMPRITGKWLDLWQESFESPLLSEAMRAELDGHIEEARRARIDEAREAGANGPAAP